MTRDTLISIIVPVYNVEKYVSSCIESLVQQSYKNIEIILINDGSTDNSLSVCKSLALLYTNIILIDQENQGLSETRNTGISHAKGKYIAFIDSDDIVHKDFVLTLHSAIGEASIAICRLKKFGQNDPVSLLTKLNEFLIISYSGEEANSLLYDQDKGMAMAVATNKLFSKEIWKTIKFPKDRYHEDIAIIYLLYDQAKSVKFIDAELYFYRTRNDSITSKRSFKSIKDEYKALSEQIDFFKKKKQNLLVRNANRARKSLFLLTELDQDWQVWKHYNIIEIIQDDLRTKVKIKLILKKINPILLNFCCPNQKSYS